MSGTTNGEVAPPRPEAEQGWSGGRTSSPERHGTIATGDGEVRSAEEAEGAQHERADEADATLHGGGPWEHEPVEGTTSWSDGLIARRAPHPESDGWRAEARTKQPGGDRLPPARSGDPHAEGGRREDGEPAGAPEGERRAEHTTAEPADSTLGECAFGHPEDSDAEGDFAAPSAAGLVPAPALPDRSEVERTLAHRLVAFGELLGLSRGRVDSDALADAARVVDEAGARRRLPDAYSVVALAGATGSGKSSLFNTLAGAQLSEVGICRPTTAAPVSCTWEAAEGEGGADGLLDRLSLAPSARRYSWDESLNGLVLVDLPDHDSVAPEHRRQVDRLLGLVDAVVWVVDPEKYADALLHERYLRAMPHHAEVTYVVLNQTDRLGEDAVGAVLDDLRRLLDRDGVALSEYGEPGATVLACSARTGDGIEELRADLASLAAARRAAALRLSADLDNALRRLRPVYINDGAEAGELGLTEPIRERFDEQLALALGARAAGEAAERAWLRGAEEASATVWARLLRHRGGRKRTKPTTEEPASAAVAECEGAGTASSRPVVAQAVRELAESSSAGLPEPWTRRVREAAYRGASGLPEALDEASHGYGRSTGDEATDVERAVALGALPASVAGASQREAPEAAAASLPDAQGGESGEAAASERPLHRTPLAFRSRRGARAPHDRRMDASGAPRPGWAPVALGGQVLMLLLQLVGAVWMLLAVLGVVGETVSFAAVLLGSGAFGAPLLSWCCRRASRAPARVHGSAEEVRLRRLAAGCGRSRVLEPVAAELLRYREAREQFVIATGEV